MAPCRPQDGSWGHNRGAVGRHGPRSRVFHFALTGLRSRRGHADRFQYYEQGDISNVVSKGTFLMSVDTVDTFPLTTAPATSTILVFHATHLARVFPGKQILTE